MASVMTKKVEMDFFMDLSLKNCFIAVFMATKLMQSTCNSLNKTISNFHTCLIPKL